MTIKQKKADVSNNSLNGHLQIFSSQFGPPYKKHYIETVDGDILVIDRCDLKNLSRVKSDILSFLKQMEIQRNVFVTLYRARKAL